jgi:hypothetical protein
MTGMRYARIQAGYATAKEAHAAFSKGLKGSEGYSLSYWIKLESSGPRLLGAGVARRIARFFGCSTNLVWAWQAPNQTKGNDDSRHSISTASPSGRRKATTTKKAPAKSGGRKTTMKTTLSDGGRV